MVFDSQLTTYKVLDELTARGVRWLTLRQRGSTELARLAALPAGHWKTATIARSGRYRRPHLHEDMIKLKDVATKVRQIAVRNIGRELPRTDPSLGSRRLAMLAIAALVTPGILIVEWLTGDELAVPLIVFPLISPWSGVWAIEPPVPPSVNEGRMIAG